MLRSEVYAWLEANGGEKNYSEKMVPVKKIVADEEVTTYERHVTWTANNGRVLTVVDDAPKDNSKGEQEAAVKAGRGKYTTDNGTEIFDPDYRVVQSGDPDNTDNRSPEQAAGQKAKHAEAEWNRANGPTPDPTSPAYDGYGRGSGIYETHTERADRERRDAQDAQAQEDRARRARTEERQTENEAKRAENDAARVEIERGRAQTEADRAATASENEKNRVELERRRVEAEEKGKGQIVGTPTDEDAQISTYNPVTGKFESVDNPNYDPVKAAAAKKREEIRLGIEAGKFNSETAIAEYNRWYQQNVTTPIAQAQERRAQAAEKRQAQEAEDRRRQAKAQNEIDRAKIGQTAAESALANERAALPYMAGPEFGEQFSSAINSLAHGGSLDRDASAGINFTAEAFEFDRPNWKKIARSATREALKNLTPYDPDETAYSIADYSGINMPTAETLQGAPAAYVPPAALTAATTQAAGAVGQPYPYNPPVFTP